jgi:glycosyltransferase involved in cell wall biosynthesis
VYRSHAAGGKFVFFRNRPPFFGIGVWLKSLLRVFRNARRGRFLAKDVFLGKSPSFSNSTDLLFSTLIHPGNVAAISNAVPSLRRQNSPFRASRGIPENALLFLSVANYCDRKGQVPLVRAFRSFSERNARLVCIGSEPNETYREAVAAAAGDERILCLADIGREEVVDAINACDVAVLFSNHEAQPLFLLEAMSCGKPWISTDVGFVSEMEGGRILAHRNRRCLHSALSEMADPAVRTSLGEEGLRHWRDHCSPDVVYRQWDALLREVATHGATA